MHKLGLIDVSETCLLAPVWLEIALHCYQSYVSTDYWTNRTDMETPGREVILKKNCTYFIFYL